MNRCIGITKTGKKCRAPVKEERECKYYCCKAHEPFNMDFFEMGCFICGESEFKKGSDLVHLKCGHVLHKPCYTEWFIEHSTYDSKVCMICRNEVHKKIEEEMKDFVKNKKGVIKSVFKVGHCMSMSDKILERIVDENKPVVLEFPEFK